MYQTLIKPLALDIKTFIFDVLFPISCLACGQEGEFVCSDCQSRMLKLEHQRCISCQKPAAFGITHPGCQTAYGADALISFYNYHDDKVAQVLIGGKYKFIPKVYEILGKIMAEKIKTQHSHILQTSSPQTTTVYELQTVFSPIPLHFSRQRWRGFNQAELLCHTLSQQLSLPCTKLLIRDKLTNTQKDLKKEQRLKNMSNAFTAVPNFKSFNPSSLNIILVDDVTTTGSTLQEAAKVLKRNGAAKVICLTVARD